MKSAEKAEFELLEARLEQRLGVRREALRKQLGHDAIVWLMLAPYWTEPLARELEFPATAELSEWVGTARAAGVCEQQTVTDRATGETVLRFWMPSSARADTLRAETRAVGRLRALRNKAAQIGTDVAAARPGLGVSPGLLKWAELAKEAPALGRGSGEWLISKVVAALKATRVGEALDWISAGDTLAPILGAELQSAVARGRRLVNLELRSRQDEMFMARFLRRGEQTGVLEELARSEPDASVWAVHFVGVGGAGKTMLVRYVTRGLAQDAGIEPLFTTRVDFDHISPKFPKEDPGQLMLELANGLTGYMTTPEQEQALKRFVETVTRAREVSGRQPVDPLHSKEFASVVTAFERLIRLLPGTVILILDTCEELAKLYPAGREIPAVEATFAILEELHRRVPTLRVVLAGRRLLTLSAANWSLPPEREGAAAGSVASLPPRRYMRVEEVRGFAEPEVRRFLAEVRDLAVSEAVLDEILAAAGETARVPELSSDAAEEVPRYNPFDLALYADWVDELTRAAKADGRDGSAGVDAAILAVLRRGTDAYVEMRILGRLVQQPELVDALPAVSVLGHFDVEILAAGLSVGPDAARLFEILAEQEWMEMRSAEESGVTVLEVQPGLLKRLRAYYGPDVLAGAQAELAPRLDDLARRRPLDNATIEHLEGALRLLDEHAATALWEQVVGDAVAAHGWSWARAACARLLGPDRNEAPQAQAFRASIRALYIATLLHEDPGYDASGDWVEVVHGANAHPDSGRANWLLRRARLGLAAGVARGSPDAQGACAPAEVLEELAGFDVASWEGAQLAAGALSAIEALLDAGADPLARQMPNAQAVERVLTQLIQAEADPALVAGWQLAHARACVREGRHGDASASFEAAEASSVGPDGAGNRGDHFLDWRVPDAQQHRVRLEWLEAMPADEQLRRDDATLDRWLDATRVDIDTIDGERLASALIADRLASEVVDTRTIAAYEDPGLDAPEFTPVCRAHERVPPLFVTVSHGWVALGNPTQALAVVDERERAAVERRSGDAAVHWTARTANHVVRRMRWRGPRDSLIYRLAGGEPSERADAWATATLIGGARPAPTADDGESERDGALVHARWRASEALTREDAKTALALLAGLGDDVRNDGLLAMQLTLDRIEAAKLAARMRLDAVFDGDIPQAELAELTERSTRGLSPGDPGDLDRLLLRAWALSDAAGAAPPPVRRGVRDSASLALEEGELMALRLPFEAIRLLDLAADRFAIAGDAVGVGLSTIAATTARVHAGDRDGASEHLAAATRAYAGLRSSIEEPPPDVRALRRRRAPHEGPWGGWVARLHALLRWSRRRVGLPRAARRRTVPAELDLKLAQPGPLTDAWVAVTAVAAAVLIVGVTIGLLLAWSAIARDLAGWLSGWDPGLALGVPLGVIALLLFAALISGGAYVVFGVLVPSLLRLARRLAVVQALVTPAGLPDVATGEQPTHLKVDVAHASLLGVPWAYVLRSGLWLARRRYAWASHVTVGRRLPSAPDPRFEALLRTLRRTFRIRQVVLVVRPPLAEYAWEAELSRELVSSTSKETDGAFDVWRKEERPARRRAALNRGGNLRVLCPHAFALFSEDAWGEQDLEVFPASALRAFESSRGARLLHLLGTPVATAAGWALRVDDADLDLDSVGTAVSADQTLAHADRMPLNGVNLVVVQETPAAFGPRADPNRGNALRGFAAAVSAAGARAVLAIPAVPPELAEKLVHATASVARSDRRALELAELLALARTLRREIFPASMGEQREHPEEALDVCVFWSG